MYTCFYNTSACTVCVCNCVLINRSIPEFSTTAVFFLATVNLYVRNMLAISTLESLSCHGGRGGVVVDDDKFSDAFSTGDFLEDVDFDDLFVGFDEGDDALAPEFEVEPNDLIIGGEKNSSSAEEVNKDDADMSGTGTETGNIIHDRLEGNGDGKGSDQTVPETEDDTVIFSDNISMGGISETTTGGKNRKPMDVSSKNSQGKRKVKVDWTPELHRRFVQAVEQLGVDKAVPSRILEIMGIDCLTRHNIASHLQKYRSHRKHMLTREAEAATWSQRRRQMYAVGSAGHTKGHKREMASPWLVPTIGFPPTPPPPSPPIRHFRPLHVWGHPTVDHAVMHMWPKHLISSHQWAPHYPPLPDPACWHHPHYPNRFPAPSTVPVYINPYHPPHQLYRPDDKLPLRPKRLPLELHPSKESVDATIGDVLSKPWLPLPLGLKPPSVESVLLELKREGIANNNINIPNTFNSIHVQQHE